MGAKPLILVFCVLGSYTMAAEHDGYLQINIDTDSCKYISYNPTDNNSRAIKTEALEPKRLGSEDFNNRNGYWRLDSRDADTYICHAPKPLPQGGYLLITHFLAQCDAKKKCSDNKLKDNLGSDNLPSSKSSMIDSESVYYPPHGYVVYRDLPEESIPYQLTAYATWVLENREESYATLTIKMLFDIVP